MVSTSRSTRGATSASSVRGQSAGSSLLTLAQIEHEQAIDTAHMRLLAAVDAGDKQRYWREMVAGIQSRDPELTERMEAERMKRVVL